MEVLKDKDCTMDTPVVLGVQDSPIYGKGISIKPRVDGRKDSKHFESIYLPELLPLEEYDLIVVLISGGKDSIACFYKLLELGVPKEKIELWHHDIDGGHPSRRMDWKCTQNYMKALADAEGVKLRVSYRVNGFFGELYRIGASEPIEWIDPDTDEVKQCKLSSNYLKCQEIKPSDWTYQDWLNSDARYILMDCPSNVLSWIWEDDMTDEEKEQHPEYSVTGGFLKHIEKETGRQMWWDGLSDRKKDIVMQLPNFDKDIFKEITGITVEG